MFVIGLTGGIATGKSTVSSLLRDRGVSIVDADVIARKVVEPGSSGLRKIVNAFGQEILQSDGTLDRKKLGSVIFSDATKRQTLNGILHPAIRRQMLWEVVKFWLSGKPYCVLDVPLLIEGPLWKLVAKVAVVYCPEEVQLERLIQRDGSSREDASARLASQTPIEDKVKYADITIDNSGAREHLACATAGHRLCGLHPLLAQLAEDVWKYTQREIGLNKQVLGSRQSCVSAGSGSPLGARVHISRFERSHSICGLEKREPDLSLQVLHRWEFRESKQRFGDVCTL